MEETRLSLLKFPTAAAVVEAVLSLSGDNQRLACLIFWDWWTTRNKIYAGEKVRTTDEVCYTIQRHLLEFSADDSPATVTPIPCLRWDRPKPGFVKVNFDAAFKQDSGDGAYGYVLRSDTGDVIAAGAGKLMYIKCALQAEAEACLAAIEGAGNMGIHRVTLESDSLPLVQALNSGDSDRAELGVLFQEARSRCILCFDDFEFVFCRRGCNSVAHALAQFGYDAAVPSTVWMEHMPDFVNVLVASDSAAPAS